MSEVDDQRHRENLERFDRVTGRLEKVELALWGPRAHPDQGILYKVDIGRERLNAILTLLTVGVGLLAYIAVK